MTKSTAEAITIRLETPDDYRETENMVRVAFWHLYKPGCDEHLVIHKLRSSPGFVKELDFVARDGNKVVDAIMCPKARVVNEQQQVSTVLSLIIGVLPSYQQRGIGSLLMKTAMDRPRALGFKGIVLFGSPEYYPSFGFRNAKEFGIQTSDGGNFDAFMALPLRKDSLMGIRSRFYEVWAHQLAKDELETFEKDFPYKEKHITDTQLRL